MASSSSDKRNDSKSLLQQPLKTLRLHVASAEKCFDMKVPSSILVKDLKKMIINLQKYGDNNKAAALEHDQVVLQYKRLDLPSSSTLQQCHIEDDSFLRLNGLNDMQVSSNCSQATTSELTQREHQIEEYDKIIDKNRLQQTSEELTVITISAQKELAEATKLLQEQTEQSKRRDCKIMEEWEQRFQDFRQVLHDEVGRKLDSLQQNHNKTAALTTHQQKVCRSSAA
eukprot:6253804-Ditylum_brightwellii.AAC.1